MATLFYFLSFLIDFRVSDWLHSPSHREPEETKKTKINNFFFNGGDVQEAEITCKALVSSVKDLFTPFPAWQSAIFCLALFFPLVNKKKSGCFVWGRFTPVHTHKHQISLIIRYNYSCMMDGNGPRWSFRPHFILFVYCTETVPVTPTVFVIE